MLIESIKSPPNSRGNAGNASAGRRAHVSRREFRRTGGTLWRSGLQYITDRLPGDLYRSFVCGSDRGSYQSPHWKLWNDAERCGVEEAVHRRISDARVFDREFELALDAGDRRVSRALWCAGDRRGGYARGGAASTGEWRDARRDCFGGESRC